mgnify:CR=1 FL=1
MKKHTAIVKVFGMREEDYESGVDIFEEKMERLLYTEIIWFGFFKDESIGEDTEVPLLFEIKFLGEEKKELGEELKKSLEKAVKEAFDRDTLFDA